MESANLPSESLALWMRATASFAVEPAERVRDRWERASRVYPDNDKKAWRSDWAMFLAFREPRQSTGLWNQ
jgi:hypothetical protein